VFIAISVSLEQFSGVAPRDHVTSSPVVQSRIFDAHCIYFFRGFTTFLSANYQHQNIMFCFSCS